MQGAARPLALLMLPVAVAAIAGAPHLPRVDSSEPLGPLMDLVGLLAWTGAMWLAVVTAVAQAAGHGMPGASGLLRRLAPSSVRALVSVTVGASVAAAALAGPAVARTTPEAPRSASTAPPAFDSLDWFTERQPAPVPQPSAAPTAVVGTAGVHDHASPAAVRVRPGDSLWRIAARVLGPRATSDAIATTWPRWWRANRAVIGADPDLIHPGAVLHSPHDQGEA